MTTTDWRQAARDEYIALLKEIEDITEKHARATTLRALLSALGVADLPDIPRPIAPAARDNRPPWTPEEDDTLRRLRLQGESYSRISALLGKSLGATQARAHRIGVSLKRSRAISEELEADMNGFSPSTLVLA